MISAESGATSGRSTSANLSSAIKFSIEMLAMEGKKSIRITPKVQEMTRAERTANLIAVVLPFAALLAAVVVLWNHGITTVDVAVMVAMYLVTALGITVG